MTMPVIKAELYHKIESFEISLCLVRRDSRSSHQDPTHTAWILSEQKKTTTTYFCPRVLDTY